MKKVEMVFLDIDGTQTNGVKTYDSSGKVSISFYYKDALAMQRLKQTGVEIVSVSAGMDQASMCRMSDINCEAHFGVSDKEQFIMNRIGDVTLDKVAYMGDELDDIPALALVGHKFCPCDANSEVLEYVIENDGLITTVEGGYGAVAAVLDHIGRVNQDQETNNGNPLL